MASRRGRGWRGRGLALIAASGVVLAWNFLVLVLPAARMVIEA